MSHADISKKRHIAKTLTWRVIASATTFMLALFFFKDDPDATEKAGGIALAESLLKMVFYYFHERIWYKSSWGIKHQRTND
ncbi:MAG: putative membrane protein [Flavobacteriales bacterium]|jgi:uncharacterized membrane protein